MKEFSTFTVVCGTMECPNNCPICISKMTSSHKLGNKLWPFKREKFIRAAKIAYRHGAANMLITGKGEPTLYPDRIIDYLRAAQDIGFDRIELQTEGCLMAGLTVENLENWKAAGLDLVALSIYHHQSDKNARVFQPPPSARIGDLLHTTFKLDHAGLETRLSCVMLKDYINDVNDVAYLIARAKQLKVMQLTLRQADVPYESNSMKVAQYIWENRLTEMEFGKIRDWLQENGHLCDVHPYGAEVYEVKGQNVALTTGLTREDPNDEDYKPSNEIRQLIWFPQGWLTTSWEYVQGGRIL